MLWNTATYGDLVEICRKPAYTFIENDTYTICEGESFTYNIQNSNAESYLWRKNEGTISSQATAVLTLNDLSVADSGDYTCEMINECGTTVTMPIHITIEACMGLDKAIGFKNAISIYPNPVTNSINIQLPERQNYTIRSFAVYNMLGQQMLSKPFKNTEINVDGLSDGVYILRIISDHGQWQGKFIKE